MCATNLVSGTHMLGANILLDRMVEKIMLYDDIALLKCTGSFYYLFSSYLMPT